MVLLGERAGEPQVSVVVLLSGAHRLAFRIIALFCLRGVVLHHDGADLEALRDGAGFESPRGRLAEAPVGLAEAGGLVSRFAEELRQRLDREAFVRDAAAVADHAQLVAVEAEHHGVAARDAHGNLAHRLPEVHAGPRQLVERRGPVGRVDDPQAVPPALVVHQEDDVGAALFRLGVNNGGGGKKDGEDRKEGAGATRVHECGPEWNGTVWSGGVDGPCGEASRRFPAVAGRTGRRSRPGGSEASLGTAAAGVCGILKKRIGQELPADHMGKSCPGFNDQRLRRKPRTPRARAPSSMEAGSGTSSPDTATLSRNK